MKKPINPHNEMLKILDSAGDSDVERVVIDCADNGYIVSITRQPKKSGSGESTPISDEPAKHVFESVGDTLEFIEETLSGGSTHNESDEESH